MAVCPYCRQPPLVASYDTLEETVAELYSNPPPPQGTLSLKTAAYGSSVK